MNHASNRCWFLPRSAPLFIQLGRFGDLLLLFPAFKLIHERTGLKPFVIVTNQYASVFEGISYAVPQVINGHWYQDMPKALALAQSQAHDAIIPQWWQPGVNDPDIPKGSTVLQCHGHGWGIDVNKYPDFSTSMWIRAGFTRDEMIATPLVIDRRNPEREKQLIAHQAISPKKPLLVYNFTGISSPFRYVPEIMAVMGKFKNDFHMLDLGTVKAQRIYDLLGIMEMAQGIITTDTATLHLCPAIPNPSIMLIVDGWTGSVPRGNCHFHCRYAETPKKLGEIEAVLAHWKSK